MEFNAIQLSCDIYLSSKFVISLASIFFCVLPHIHSYDFREQKKNMSELGEKYAHILSMSLFPH